MNDIIPAWVAKSFYAVGVAAVLGSGGALITNAKDVAVLQAQQQEVEKKLDRIEGKIDVLVDKAHAHPVAP